MVFIKCTITHSTIYLVVFLTTKMWYSALPKKCKYICNKSSFIDNYK